MQSIGGYILKDMISVGAQLLEKNRESVDALNVFPVPDGDTGTNMSLTMNAAVKEMNGNEHASAAKLADIVAKGALRGARGNSGVILSQIFRGFARGMEGKTEIAVRDFALAWDSAAKTAYKAVMKPKEGTILTVVRSLAEEAMRAADDSESLEALMETMLAAGEKMLARTPDMLPALKQAGVVDSGGKGLLILFTGMLAGLRGDALDGIMTEFDFGNVEQYKKGVAGEEIEYAYCTELIVKTTTDLSDQLIDSLRNTFGNLGDSLVLVADPPLVKVHVHTNRPGKALNIGLDLGELMNVKIDNMRQQHAHIVEEFSDLHSQIEKKKPFGFVAVSLGEGFDALFHDLGVDRIVGGGQTMNPSIDDICKALESISAETTFILPNNSNIIMAAQQAAEIVEGDIRVLRTKSVPQGIAAMIAFMPDSSADENEETMTEALRATNTAQVTYAVRNSQVGEQVIHEGDYIGLENGQIMRTGPVMEDVFMESLHDLANEETAIVTVYYGKDVSEQDAEAFMQRVSEDFPDVDVVLHNGGQPLYYFMASVE